MQTLGTEFKELEALRKFKRKVENVVEDVHEHRTNYVVGIARVNQALMETKNVP